ATASMSASEISRQRICCMGTVVYLRGLALWRDAERLAHFGRPFCQVSSVGVEHRDRKAVHPECDASSMRRLAVGVGYAPGCAEMIAVIVEAHAGRRLLFRTQRHQQLELQRLLLLAHRFHLADTPEERIAGMIDPESQAEVARNRLRALHPALAKVCDIV